MRATGSQPNSHPGAYPGTRRKRLCAWAPWVALVIVLAVSLAIGMGHSGARPSEAARAAHLTSEIRCPTCRGLSAAESDAKTAHAIRDEVARLVHNGQSDGEILASIRDRYGSDILLRPPGSGFDGLVWALPVAALVLAVAGLFVAFRRWRSAIAVDPTAEDAARVARALDEGKSVG